MGKVKSGKKKSNKSFSKKSNIDKKDKKEECLCIDDSECCDVVEPTAYVSSDSIEPNSRGHKLRPIEGIEDLEIKDSFKEHFEKMTDYDEFMKYNLSYLRRAIRVNTLKISVEELIERLPEVWQLTPVPWCKEGFWIEHKEGRRDVGNLIEHALGYIYIQEPASMVPPVVLDPRPGDIVLDMCSAPGSKTSQIAQYMENEGLLISNDYKGLRLQSLGLNYQRMGITCGAITLMSGHRFARADTEYDKILVDAPCSGTGTIRKSLKTIQAWNHNSIKKLASQQKQLLLAGFEKLKKGGTLVYSTCSVEAEENEAVVDFLVQRCPDAKIMPIDLPINRGEVIMELEGEKFHPDVKHVLRLWPQDNDTEGFFVAKIVKE